MDISRRVLLKAGAMCAAGAVFSTARYTNLLDAIPAASLPQLSLAAFSPRRNEIFRVSHQGRTTALTLIEVRDLVVDRVSRPGSGECFSLLFHAPSKASLKQGTYRLSNPALGTLALFLVPVNQPLPDGGAHYEAIINRITRVG